MISNENSAHASFRAALVVPCFNEGKRLDVAAFRSYLSERHGIRIIFADDGSSDNTVEVLQRVCQGYEDSTHILRGGKNRGKAEAVRMGLLYTLNESDQRRRSMQLRSCWKFSTPGRKSTWFSARA